MTFEKHSIEPLLFEVTAPKTSANKPPKAASFRKKSLTIDKLIGLFILFIDSFGGKMYRFKPTSLAVFLIFSLLSACGGSGGGVQAVPVGSGGGVQAVPVGSGGGVGTVPFDKWSNLQENGTVQLEGRGISSSFEVDTTNNRPVLNEFVSNDSATLELERSNGNTDRVNFKSGSASVSFNTDTEVISRNGDRQVIFESIDEQDLAAVGAVDVNNLEHQGFGAWLSNVDANSGDFAVASAGTRTDAANVPNGSASYSGISTGIALLSDGNGYITGSEVSVTTSDFTTLDIASSNTIATRISDFEQVGTPELDFSGNATVSGSNFTGSISGTVVSGNINGDLFGPNAEEVGGVFESQSGSTSYIGSFGAVRN